jgi:hypothetical protein
MTIQFESRLVRLTTVLNEARRSQQAADLKAVFSVDGHRGGLQRLREERLERGPAHDHLVQQQLG